MNVEKTIEVDKREETVLFAEPARKLNRMRDIGLYLAVAALFFGNFLWWRESAAREKVDLEANEYFKREIEAFRRDFITKKEKKSGLKDAVIKLTDEHMQTRKLIDDQTLKLNAITEALRRIEKKGSK